MSTSARRVGKNGLPRMNGTSLSSIVSSITISAGNTKLPSLTSNIYAIICGNMTKRSASGMLILVGDGFLNTSLMKSNSGVKLMLEPKSAKAFSIRKLCIPHGIVKLRDLIVSLGFVEKVPKGKPTRY